MSRAIPMRRILGFTTAVLLAAGLSPREAEAEWPQEIPTGLGAGVADVRVATDPADGDLFLAGAFSGLVELPDGVPHISTQGTRDVFVAKFDRDGVFQWVQVVTSRADLDVGGIAFESDGVWIAGTASIYQQADPGWSTSSLDVVFGTEAIPGPNPLASNGLVSVQVPPNIYTSTHHSGATIFAARLNDAAVGEPTWDRAAQTWPVTVPAQAVGGAYAIGLCDWGGRSRVRDLVVRDGTPYILADVEGPLFAFLAGNPLGQGCVFEHNSLFTQPQAIGFSVDVAPDEFALVRPEYFLVGQADEGVFGRCDPSLWQLPCSPPPPAYTFPLTPSGAETTSEAGAIGIGGPSDNSIFASYRSFRAIDENWRFRYNTATSSLDWGYPGPDNLSTDIEISVAARADGTSYWGLGSGRRYVERDSDGVASSPVLILPFPSLICGFPPGKVVDLEVEGSALVALIGDPDEEVLGVVRMGDTSWFATATSCGPAGLRATSLAVGAGQVHVGAVATDVVTFQPGGETFDEPGTRALATSLGFGAGNWLLTQDWVVGQPIEVPALAVPGVEPIASVPGEPPLPPALARDYFFWDAAAAEVWPVEAVDGMRLTWPTVGGEEVTLLGNVRFLDFPSSNIPQLFARGGSVVLEPDGLTRTFEALYSGVLVPTASVVDGLLVTTALTDHIVLRYREADDSPFFVVARAVDPDELPGEGTLDLVDCTVGTPLTEDKYGHDDPGRSGAPIPPSPIDAFGSRKIFDPVTRMGRLVAVNTADATDNDLVVVWYGEGAGDLHWPTKPVSYTCGWPTEDIKKIVIDELVGSEVNGQAQLDPDQFPEAHVYVQNDPTELGFNPNEEHAFLAPSNPEPSPDAPPLSEFSAVFALKHQADTSASEPFVLLKYRDPLTNEWKFRIFEVIESEGDTAFEYQVTAGDRVPSPYPLGLLGPCPGTQGSRTPFWKDVRGNVYGRANGVMQVDYFYPLLADFFWDPDGTGENTGNPGDCVRWLEDPPGTPKLVDYQVSWPEDAPLLRVGQTLIHPVEDPNGRFLPDIFGQAAVDVVFQGNDPIPGDFSPANESIYYPDPQALVKLYPPRVGRRVPIEPAHFETWRKVIDKAPVALALRLSIDELTNELVLSGFLDDGDVGDPLLLLDVLGEAERDLLQNLYLDECDSDCVATVNELYEVSRNPDRLDLGGTVGEPDVDDPGTPRDEGLLIGLQAVGEERLNPDGGDAALGEPKPHRGTGAVLSAGAARATGWVTVAFNNDPDLSLPITLSIIRVGCDATGRPYPGQIHTLPTDNVFDERLTLRHSGDFGAEPEEVDFEWYRNTNDEAWPGGGWEVVVPGPLDAASELTLTELTDSFLLTSYTTGTMVCPAEGIDQFQAGEPGSAPVTPKLAEGWVKRVIRGLNPFHARSLDFHTAPANTYVSLIRQAGEPYQGDIAFNGDAAAVGEIGLIEAYETVLRRARSLSIDHDPPVSDPAVKAVVDSALLLAASRIADLNVLLGDEAWADAADPTIGFSSRSGEYGSLAPTIFAFQNQLPSLLEEELALLRGRDGTGAGIDVPPVFNRLLWNFTSGEGEVAYAQIYDIADETGDGNIDEADARRQYPQGHGDAWGYYLGALDSFYRLLRHREFSWRARAEKVVVAGLGVTVDYRDERKFARAAANKARTGAEILSLTYRQHYQEDPALQYRGYPDEDPDRAWGIDGWARRAGQGALFDWVMGNALLPDEWEEQGAEDCPLELLEALDDEGDAEAECPPAIVFEDVGKIDRTKVLELGEIAVHLREIRARVDEADAGLNPLGLAKGVVPFDISPALVDLGQTHYEQVAERARKALANTVSVFDHANRLSQSLRRNQDSLEDFRENVSERERDFENRMLEIFGYPYPDDVGAGGTYPAGYDGPDLYHWMYVDASALTGTPEAPREMISGIFTPLPDVGFFFGDDYDPAETLEVEFELEPQGVGVVKPAAWTGERPAPGEIQRRLSDYFRAQSAFETSLVEYRNAIARIQDESALLEEIGREEDDQIRLVNLRIGEIETLNERIHKLTIRQVAFEQTAGAVERVADVAAIAAAGDIPAAIASGVAGAAYAVQTGFSIAAAAVETNISDMERAKEEAELHFELQLINDTADSVALAQTQKVQQAIRAEPVVRYEVFQRQEAMAQALGVYRSSLARGLRLIEERVAFRRSTAADIQDYRYQDFTFRVARNDALQKYRAQFDLAARYAYLAATAYDYETNLLGSATGSGREFLTDIVRHRTLGQILDGQPVPGSRGLADPLARLDANFAVLKGQLGFNNPQTETSRFSLRHELLRKRESSDAKWQAELEKYLIDDLWELPEFRRFASPMAPAPPFGPKQPALVIGLETKGGRPIRTTVTSGSNFFGWPLGGGDSSYDPSNFATRIRSVGVWFENYNATSLPEAPRVYLLPVGADFLRTPQAGNFDLRQWNVVDQVLPVPFPIGELDLADPEWIPLNDTLSGPLGAIRQIGRIRAYHDSGGFDPSETTTDSRLIGRSVWNDRWLLIIPAETLGSVDLNEPFRDLNAFIETVTDIRLFFQTYAYSGSAGFSSLQSPGTDSSPERGTVEVEQ